MEQLVINAKIRKETGKKAAKALRETGRIPAIAYNEKGESTMLDVDANEFSKVWRTITPTTLIKLVIDGQENQAYIQDTEYDIITDKNLHADFHIVSGQKPIVARLKIHYSGTPAGVLKGGFLVKHVPDVKLKALPADMPQSIVADISKVEIGQKYTIKDLGLSDKLTILSNPNDLVVTIAPPRK
ncbi:MAG: 50S ribosomal protein L25 [Treponema sp.]|nr:50S ribosomal protein L25 [Treponema sp.]MCR5623262.1 50S ribosomal protein L25 [Treponema sp.]